MCLRLAAIDVMTVISRNTVTSLAHRGTVPHRRLDCFYSNKIISFSWRTLQLKLNAAAQCNAPIDRTNESLASQQSRFALPAVPTRFRRRINFPNTTR